MKNMTKVPRPQKYVSLLRSDKWDVVIYKTCRYDATLRRVVMTRRYVVGLTRSYDVTPRINIVKQYDRMME